MRSYHGLAAIGTCIISLVLSCSGIYYLILYPSHPSRAHRAILYLLAFLLSYTLHLISLLRTIVTDPGSIPIGYKSDLATSCERKRSNSLRYCRKCNQYKPDRCHHCHSCGRCVLHMDHCCVFVSNCIGQYNHKYFLLLLFWSVMSSLGMSLALVDVHGLQGGTLLQRIASLFHYRHHVAMTAMIFSVVATALFVFLLFHLILVANNLTTIELNEKRGYRCRSKYKNLHNKGIVNNFRSVFGRRPYMWLIPVYDDFPEIAQFKQQHVE